LLVGLGRLSVAGWTMVLEGVARIAFALVFVGIGLRVGGAAAGLALGVLVGFVATELLVPRRRSAAAPPVSPEVWASIVGLTLVGPAGHLRGPLPARHWPGPGPHIGHAPGRRRNGGHRADAGRGPYRVGVELAPGGPGRVRAGVRVRGAPGDGGVGHAGGASGS